MKRFSKVVPAIPLFARGVATTTKGLTMEQQKLSVDARSFYNNSGPGGGKDRNWLLSQSTGGAPASVYTNHHFGIGDMAHGLDLTDDNAVLREVHRLEMAQIDELIAALGPLNTEDYVLDAGSGRGGTAFRVFEEAGGCKIEGVTLAEDQAAYANDMANQRGISDQVKFHVRNMLHLTPKTAPDAAASPAPIAMFKDGTFSKIYANETDMYIVDATVLYSQFHSLLKPGGRFALATWCNAAPYGKVNPYSEKIDKNYGTLMHTDDELFEGLKAAGFSDITCKDFTQEARPYWDVRSRWSHASGVEAPFVDGLACGQVRYLIYHGTKA